VFRRQRKHRNSAIAPRLTFRTLLSVRVAVSLLVALLPLQAQNSVTLEYQAKANYLAKFPMFVEWPESALPPGQDPFLLCVFGEYPFGISLAETTRGATIHQRRIEARWIHKEADLHACQILFVSRSEQKRYRRVLDVVSGQMVLTVGETPEFLDAGGIVCFSMQQGTLQFEVDLDGANKARLKISSRLLALARRVVTRTEAAKS
jgi:hypothetical protein